MSLALSTSESVALSRAMSTLLSPTDHATVGAWQSAVNRTVAGLVGADSVGFMLEVPGGPPLHSDEHDPKALAQFPEYPLPLLEDGRPALVGVADVGAATLEETWEGKPERFLSSAHFADLAAPNRAFDTLSAAVLVTSGSMVQLAGLLCWHERPTGRRFGIRERQVLSLLVPALKAGVTSALLGSQREAEVVGVFDDLDHATLVADDRGQVIHRSRRLERELEADPERALILSELNTLARSLSAFGGRHRDAVERPRFASDVVTARARYALHGSMVAGHGPVDRPLVLVSLQRLTPVVLGAAQLQERLGLTAGQARVARALATGATNDHIANSLHLSPHTVRRHTEAILLRAGVRSRSELIPHLLH
jgi:DNA-binding NarL/FixJ family response regulator